MPFPLIPTVLAVGFLLVWILIGGMMLRDGQRAACRERELDTNILPIGPNRSPRAHAANTRRAKSA
jgi:uncharacterized membrane protein YciS (DUF1049 family)